MNISEQKKIITKYNLTNTDNLLDFINKNPENLTIDKLSLLAEITNNKRSSTAAYYTRTDTLKCMYEHLPELSFQNTIKILEPSVGIGNFLEIIIQKYSKITNELIIDVNDIDARSLKILKSLNNYRHIPENVTINYYNVDFLDYLYFKNKTYDLVLGNPPFLKLNKKNGIEKYSKQFNDDTTKNISGFFIQKSLMLSKNVFLIMPKYMLSNQDFKMTRHQVNNHKINKIIDFGEKGFKGVLIETIAILIDTKSRKDDTFIYSIPLGITNKQPQNRITDRLYPFWLIYRDQWFDEVASKMKFNVFNVFRDRQLTNKFVSTKGEIRVLKSKNICRDGRGIKNIENYDKYSKKSLVLNFQVYKYLNEDDIFLAPNMTYYPRVVKKPKNTLVNGSIAILIPKNNINIKQHHLDFFNSANFERFYRIARNYATRSLNIDKTSIFFFGLYDN